MTPVATSVKLMALMQVGDQTGFSTFLRVSRDYNGHTNLDQCMLSLPLPRNRRHGCRHVNCHCHCQHNHTHHHHTPWWWRWWRRKKRRQQWWWWWWYDGGDDDIMMIKTIMAQLHHNGQDTITSHHQHQHLIHRQYDRASIKWSLHVSLTNESYPLKQLTLKYSAPYKTSSRSVSWHPLTRDRP